MLSLTRFAEAVVGLALGMGAILVGPTQAPPAAGAASPAVTTQAAVASDDDATMKEHAVDVVDYTMSAVLDRPEHEVHGTATIVWRNTSTAAVRELWFHLYLNAFKNERTVFLRAPVASGRGMSAVADWGYIDVSKLVARELDGLDLWPGADKTSPGDPDDQTDIRVPLPREILPGETLTLETTFLAKLPSIVERTGFADDFYMVAQWFPKLARLESSGQWRHFPFYHLTEFYADFGTYDVTLDVPSGMVVGATGQRLSFESAKGRDVMRYRQTDVHDFAWTAWASYREKTARAEGVEIRALFPPGYAAVADREIATVSFALKYFGEHYGRYPYPVLTLVHPPETAGEAGGMEYPTLITCGGAWYDPPFFHDVEAITIHEFGHQYFYGLVATDEQSWPVLDEGINSFAEADSLAAMYGPGSGIDLLGLQVSVESVLRLGSTRAAHNEPVAQAAQAFASGGDYGALVYGRTATILETLSRVYGHDQLMAALGRYTRRYRFEHPTLDQFVDVIRKGLGEGAAKNLDTALSERGWVDYVLANAVSKHDDVPAGVFDRAGKRETIARGTSAAPTWQGWALVMRHGTLHFPVDIELFGEDGTSSIAHWDGAEDWIRIPYEGKSELARVIVDPDVKVTLDENLFNNGLRISPMVSPRRSLERATYFAEIGFHGLLP
jgi:hypothetical protein